VPRTGLTAKEIKEYAIDAALTKMREVGFDKVRLSDIAKDLNVSHAALYSHFRDKSDLLDAVSERWLLEIDEKLDMICGKRKDPQEKIHEWALEIHRSKLEKVRRDPELYKGFDLAAQESKPFVKAHLENLHRQLSGMVEEALEKRGLQNVAVEDMVKIISASVVGFHHPRLVAQFVNENRENLLRQVIDSVLRGLDLKD
jgi:AcrR family transcriptional regulator